LFVIFRALATASTIQESKQYLTLHDDIEEEEETEKTKAVCRITEGDGEARCLHWFFALFWFVLSGCFE
jgi:hypothetical protein